MEVQITIVVQQLRMQLVDQMRGLLHAAALHRLADQDAIVQRVEGDRWLDARLGAELLSRLLEALCMRGCVCGIDRSSLGVRIDLTKTRSTTYPSPSSS